MLPLFVQPDVQLSVEGSDILLRRGGVSVSHTLSIAEGIALSFLAATGDFQLAAEACRECLPNGDYWLSHIVSRFWTYLGEGTCRPIEPAWLAKLARCRPKLPLLPSSRVKQEPAPANIVWMVTLGCHRRCPYCFFNVFPHEVKWQASPKDATFPFDSVVRMIREMALIGSADLYLTGGEPLLRKDLVDVLKEAKRVRVRTHITTRYPIRPSLARELSDAGLTSITYSLDDARPREAAKLSGARNYLAEATEALRALVETPINLEVNAVATQLNVEGLEILSDYLVKLGVPKLKIRRFNASYPARPSAHCFATPPFLSERVRLIEAKHKGRLSIELDARDPSKTELSFSCADHAVCEVGTRSLHVMPDGSVSRCRYLPDTPEMVVGSLLTSTLLDIWNSVELHSLTRPTRKPFEGTSCFQCGSHETCNSRGRCYVSSLMNAGRLHAPDRYCSWSAS